MGARIVFGILVGIMVSTILYFLGASVTVYIIAGVAFGGSFAVVTR